MENYIALIGLGVVFIIVSFLSGCWYTKWKSGIKKEKEYDSLIKQFKKYEADDEYNRLRQRLEDEIDSYKSDEQNVILQRRLYAIKSQWEKEKCRVLIATGIALLFLILSKAAADVFTLAAFQYYVPFFNLTAAAVYIFYISRRAAVGRNCFKVACVLEDILRGLKEGTPLKSQDKLNLRDMNDLVNTLKPVKKEHSVSDLL